MKHKLPIPPRHIFDPKFAYVPSSKTDIAATFERIRSEMAKQQTKTVRRVK